LANNRVEQTGSRS